MTTSMMYLWLRNQLLQTVPIVLILPDWQDIYSYYQFLFTSNAPTPPSLLCYKVNRVRTWLILLLPYKKHKKSLEAFFLTNDPFVIPCYSSFTPQVKSQHFQNLCPTYHFILWWIFCFMWSAITSFFISHFSGPPKHLNSSMSFAQASLMFCLAIRQLLASLS